MELPSNTPIVLLREQTGTRFLPLWVGAMEAMAISSALDGIEPARPMTHDLLRELFEAFGAEVTDIVIDDLREGTFFAKVRYVFEDEESTLDARPSDAVALAVRTDAPIFVSAEVLDEAGIPADDGDDEVEAVHDRDRDVSETASKAMSRLDRMESQLQKAIAEEDYETAAKLRDEIARMKEDN